MTERRTPKIFRQLPLAFREPDDLIIPRGHRGKRRARDHTPATDAGDATTDEPSTPCRVRRDRGGNEPTA